MPRGNRYRFYIFGYYRRINKRVDNYVLLVSFIGCPFPSFDTLVNKAFAIYLFIRLCQRKPPERLRYFCYSFATETAPI